MNLSFTQHTRRIYLLLKHYTRRICLLLKYYTRRTYRSLKHCNLSAVCQNEHEENNLSIQLTGYYNLPNILVVVATQFDQPCVRYQVTALISTKCLVSSLYQVRTICSPKSSTDYCTFHCCVFQIRNTIRFHFSQVGLQRMF